MYYMYEYDRMYYMCEYDRMYYMYEYDRCTTCVSIYVEINTNCEDRNKKHTQWYR